MEHLRALGAVEVTVGPISARWLAPPEAAPVAVEPTAPGISPEAKRAAEHAEHMDVLLHSVGVTAAEAGL